MSEPVVHDHGREGSSAGHHEARPSASTACWAAHALATISLPDDLRILAKVDDGNDDVGLKVLAGNVEDAKRKSVKKSSPDRGIDDGEE